MCAIAEVEGYSAEPFALPTAFFLKLTGGEMDGSKIRMTRVEEGAVDLGRLVSVDRIFNDVIDGTTTIEEARFRLRSLKKTEHSYPRVVRWAAIAASSGAIAVFFGGGVVEIVAAMLTGLLIYAFSVFVSKNPSGRFLLDFFGGFVAACAAAVAAKVRPTIAYEIVVLAGVISLIPGMKFTTGLAELARKSLVSGGARLH